MVIIVSYNPIVNTVSHYTNGEHCQLLSIVSIVSYIPMVIIVSYNPMINTVSHYTNGEHCQLL